MTYANLIRHCAALIIAMSGAATLNVASAADGPSSAASDQLAGARALIAENKWVAAIEELKKLNDTGSADWNNLMGYSHRKAKSPDFAAAERYYNAALALDPKHRGALEYSGELYLMMGELAKAEQRLAALDKACLFSCAEYRDLKEAVARFKANGNRHLAN